MKHVLLEVGITYGSNDKKVRSYMPLSCDSSESPLAFSQTTLKTRTPLKVVMLVSQLVDLTNGEVLKDRSNDAQSPFEQYATMPITPWKDVLADLEVAWTAR